MNSLESLQSFVNIFNDEVPIIAFIFGMGLTTIFSTLLAMVYTRFGNSLSNRSLFSKNFPLLALTTMLIITIVKSSLALSLGLVGALSIVRFRAAIKEPEELAYLFLNIAIGLGFGAGQLFITSIAFVVIITLLISSSLFTKKRSYAQYIYLTVSGIKDTDFTLKKIINILNESSSKIDLKRFDEKDQMLESAFAVTYKRIDDLEKTVEKLQSLSKNVSVTFIDANGLG